LKPTHKTKDNRRRKKRPPLPPPQKKTRWRDAATPPDVFALALVLATLISLAVGVLCDSGRRRLHRETNGFIRLFLFTTGAQTRLSSRFLFLSEHAIFKMLFGSVMSSEMIRATYFISHSLARGPVAQVASRFEL
jgi:hypothetical protein